MGTERVGRRRRGPSPREVHQKVLWVLAIRAFYTSARRRHPDESLPLPTVGSNGFAAVCALRVRGGPGREKKGDCEKRTSRATCSHDGSPGGDDSFAKRPIAYTGIELVEYG